MESPGKAKKIYTRALDYFNKTIQENPDSPEAYTNRGMAWAEKDDPDRAMRDYDQALTINPLYTEALTQRGILWGKMGDLDKAVADYNKALAINRGEAAEETTTIVAGSEEDASGEGSIQAKSAFNSGIAFGKKGDLDNAHPTVYQSDRNGPHLFKSLL